MNSTSLKTKELLRYHCGSYGNTVAIVAIATGYLGDAYFPNETLSQI